MGEKELRGCGVHCYHSDHIMTLCDDVFDSFLHPSQLKRTLVLLINNSSQFFKDPLIEIICLILSSPFSLVLTEKGVALFKANYVAIIYFKQLTQKQTQAVSALLEDSLQNDDYHVILQRSGGMCVHVPEKLPRVVQHSDVLISLHQLLHRSQLPACHLPSGQICNVILQRVRNMVHIDHKSLVVFRQYIEDERSACASDGETVGGKRKREANAAQG
jgi:hypothetical protein